MDTQVMDRSLPVLENTKKKNTKELILERLDRLPLYHLQQVLTFSDFMLYEVAQSSQPLSIDNPQKGTPQDLLACVGLWQFDPGELEEIMADIEQGRSMELGKNDIVLD